MITLSEKELGHQLEVIGSEEMTSEATNLPYQRVKVVQVLSEMYTDDGRLMKRVHGKEAFEIHSEGKGPAVGAFIGGIIKTFKTTPYKIGENTVDSITVVVREGDDAVKVANKRLERNQASVLDASGNPTKQFAPVITDEKKAGQPAGAPAGGTK